MQIPTDPACAAHYTVHIYDIVLRDVGICIEFESLPYFQKKTPKK